MKKYLTTDELLIILEVILGKKADIIFIVTIIKYSSHQKLSIKHLLKLHVVE